MVSNEIERAIDAAYLLPIRDLILRYGSARQRFGQVEAGLQEGQSPTIDQQIAIAIVEKANGALMTELANITARKHRIVLQPRDDARIARLEAVYQAVLDIHPVGTKDESGGLVLLPEHARLKDALNALVSLDADAPGGG